jgi:hypothetical protein
MHDAALFVDAIPDATGTCHLELPLFEDPTADRPRPELALQWMLSGAARARIRAKRRPSGQCAAG